MVLCAFAFAFLCAEVGGRIWIYSQYRKEVAKYRSSPYKVEAESPMEYRLYPNLARTVDIKGFKWNYTVNSRGFRGGEIELRKRTGVKRILFLGDSVTFGYGVEDTDTLPAQFEALWNDRENAPFKLEAVNLGVPGYNTIQECALLEEQLELWSPDVIVLTYVLNDAEPQGTVPPRPPQVFHHVRSWFLEELKTELNETFFAQDPFFRSNKNFHDLERPERGFEAGKEKARESRDALGRIARLCRDRRVSLLFAVAPDVSQALTEEYPYTRIHDLVMDWAEELELESVDLLPVVRGRRSVELSVPNDGHPNAAAHRLFALALLPDVEALLIAR